MDNKLYGHYIVDDYAISRPPTSFRANYSYSMLSEAYAPKPNAPFSIVYNATEWPNAVHVTPNIKYNDVLFIDSNIESHYRME